MLGFLLCHPRPFLPLNKFHFAEFFYDLSRFFAGGFFIFLLLTSWQPLSSGCVGLQKKYFGKNARCIADILHQERPTE